MSKKPWITAAVTLTLGLGLAGCGNGEDEPAIQDGAPEATQDVPAEEPTQMEVTPGDEQVEEAREPDTQEPAGPANGDAEVPLDAGEGTAGEEPPTMGADTVQTDEQEPPVAPETEVPETRDDTAGTIDEQTALPGETSEADIDEFMQETERRFEEAQRRLEEQFEEAEQQRPETIN